MMLIVASSKAHINFSSIVTKLFPEINHFAQIVHGVLGRKLAYLVNDFLGRLRVVPVLVRPPNGPSCAGFDCVQYVII